MLTISRLARRLGRAVSDGRRSENGAVAPLIGLLILVLVGCVGISIDTGRAMVVKARLGSALDAAGLAVGARTTTTDYTGDARKFVDANFATNYAGATVTSVTAALSADKSTISLAATAEMPTIFMKIFGTKTVAVNALSEITRASTGLELVLVLDNTGSMEESSSMDALKSGAKSLVDGLLTADSKDVYIGLVPFSQAVNVGPGLASSNSALADPVKATDISSVARDGYPDYWTGCVEERGSGLDETDEPPTATNANSLFKAYYSPDTETDSYMNRTCPLCQKNNWISINRFLFKTYNIFYTGHKNTQQKGPAAFCPKPMTPMTKDKSKIVAGIDAMTAQGSTFINLGAIWGWRMLSPRWRGSWGGDMPSFKLPLDYNTKNMNKVAVIMTDGENSFTDKYYSGYGYLSDGRLGTTDRATAEANLDTKLSSACTRMKQNGILVMTIAYSDPDEATKTLLKDCATNTNYYFDAGSSTTSLISTFTTIYGALSQLRVSK